MRVKGLASGAGRFVVSWQVVWLVLFCKIGCGREFSFTQFYKIPVSGSVYMSMPLSHFVPAYPSPSLYPQVHSLVGLCLYSRLAPRFFMTFFFFVLDSIYMLAYSICFSLSDLLHSVWQTLGPSTSLQITQYVKQITRGKQPHSTGRSAQCFVTTWRGGIGRVGGRETQEERDMGTYVYV